MQVGRLVCCTVDCSLKLQQIKCIVCNVLFVSDPEFPRRWQLPITWPIFTKNSDENEEIWPLGEMRGTPIHHWR